MAHPGEATPDAAVFPFLREAALRSLGDAVLLRDPAGRSKRPHLVPSARQGEPGFAARGPFVLHLRYRVPKDEGVLFCSATGDENPIHTEGEIVPGAYTAAKAVLPIEVLFPDLEVASVSVRFSAIATYDRAHLTSFRCVPQPGGGLRVEVASSQEGAAIAALEVEARPIDPERTVFEVARRKVNVERLKAVRAFIRALHVAPHAYFGHATKAGYFYPRSFLAALPSGEMVRQLRGEGGLLNKLTLDFVGSRVPITGRKDPAVTIEKPKATRKTFNKILAAITDGIKTYVRGSALVLRGGEARLALTGGGTSPAVEVIPPER